MNLSASLLSVLWGECSFTSISFLGTNQQAVLPLQHNATALASEDGFLNAIPAGFEQVSISFVKDNLAVIPGEWEAGGISQFALTQNLLIRAKT